MLAVRVAYVLVLLSATSLAQSPALLTQDSGAIPARHWRQIGQGLPTLPIGNVRLIADPVNSSILYAISGPGLLFKTTDRSNSWTALSAVTGVYSLLVDPKSPDSL